MTADLAKDALDFFLLGGLWTKLSRRLGIEAVSLKYEPEAKGVAIKKAVGESLSVTYGAEQTGAPQEKIETKQQVSVEKKVGQSGAIQLEAEKTLQPLQDEAKDEPLKKEPADDSVWLKYKKRF